MVGFYTTKELDDKISEFDINHRSISKSDLINFCIQYTFDNSDEESIAKHISDYQESRATNKSSSFFMFFQIKPRFVYSKGACRQNADNLC
ncbi:hypothetical protein [Peribacillus frigoritolerans]|uniref:hypothetical protein n=1 Tax=Peribacillus frigoritolerans TaxID=450367 RepID=UPI002B24EB77|nr:hypothetical protein [Peribacillus frigoritolerans]MEB2630971.1 hypothetical protein [Peribacillus frigoritolerans]